MKNKSTLLTAASITLMSASAMAHEKLHTSLTTEIAHWLTQPDHLLTIGVAALVAFLLTRKTARQKN